ncbi:MAG: GNAT family N-acetyltransferase [Reichenbachiella sp.]|uniref:GNAT family N-acetyltransferase n=1 Tax=Reichenbachiella sp. TaxID=2184521 RepID=UPI0029674813|nr:GNAT family N-acetyltransferase [Reichenbachiella sp.]MDW3211602.1 GNAT family N-acetyltransferase [Reichenbachiella sp.]
MSVNRVIVRKGSIEEVVRLSNEIPEFDNPHDKEVYEDRLKSKKHLIAIAQVEGELAGFKVGYDKLGNSSFYTWMGGVLPKFRKMGVAKVLADFQEQYAIEEGFDSVILKTRNRHKNMLHFALKSGFEIIEVEPRVESSENRILLKKQLK